MVLKKIKSRLQTAIGIKKHKNRTLHFYEPGFQSFFI